VDVASYFNTSGKLSPCIHLSIDLGTVIVMLNTHYFLCNTHNAKINFPPNAYCLAA